MITARQKKVLVRLAIALLPLIAIGASLFFYTQGKGPGGRTEIVRLDAGNVDALRQDFNAAVGGTRVVLLLSPT